MCHSRGYGYGCHRRRRDHVGILPLAASFIAGRLSSRTAAPIAAPPVSQPLAPQVNGRTYRDVDHEKAPQASGKVYRYADEEIDSAPPAYEKGSKIAVAEEKDIDVLNAYFDRGMRMDEPKVMRAVFDQPSGSFYGVQRVQAGESVQPMTWWEEKRARKQERRDGCHQKKEESRAARLQRRAERDSVRYAY